MSLPTCGNRSLISWRSQSTSFAASTRSEGLQMHRSQNSRSKSREGTIQRCPRFAPIKSPLVDESKMDRTGRESLAGSFPQAPLRAARALLEPRASCPGIGLCLAARSKASPNRTFLSPPRRTSFVSHGRPDGVFCGYRYSFVLAIDENLLAKCWEQSYRTPQGNSSRLPHDVRDSKGNVS